MISLAVHTAASEKYPRIESHITKGIILEQTAGYGALVIVGAYPGLRV